MGKLLRPDVVAELKRLARNPFLQPPEIRELEEWVNGEMRALIVREAILQTVDEEGLMRAARVELVKRRLDDLYTTWAEGELAAPRVAA